MFLFIYLFLMKVNLCLKLADGSYEYHNVPSCLRFWPISFVECCYWPRNETYVLQSTWVIKMKDASEETVLYWYVWRWERLVWRVEWISQGHCMRCLAYEDSCCIWISIFELLMIRYSCIWICLWISLVFEFL